MAIILVILVKEARVNNWILSILASNGDGYIIWLLCIAMMLVTGFAASELGRSKWRHRYRIKSKVEKIARGSFFGAAGTFFAGVILIVGACFYGQDVAAPVTWFAHLPAQEDHFFQEQTASRKDPISILDFANLEGDYHDVIKHSQKNSMLTQQRHAMADVESTTVRRS